MTQTIVFYSLFLHSHRFIQFFIKEKSDLTSISQMLQKKHRWFAVSTLSIFFFQICIHTSRNIVARKSLNIWIFLDALLFLKIRELVENRKFLKIRLFWLIQLFIILFNWRDLLVNRWCWDSWWRVVVFWIEKERFVWVNRRERWIFNYRIFDNRRDCSIDWAHKQIHRDIYLKFERFRCWAHFKSTIWCSKRIARSCERLYDRRHHRMLVDWAILTAMFKQAALADIIVDIDQASASRERVEKFFIFDDRVASRAIINSISFVDF